ncbi:MAG: hypothetical protein FH748_05650 [Balneolaceae bacterium]|nr:hypothetical protein [Balneolaceae bacterium]
MRVAVTILGVCIGLVFLHPQDIYAQDISEAETKNCIPSLSYRIGEIDPRFDITEDHLKNAAKQATNVWSEVVNKPIAFYSENGEIEINLVYDNQQKQAQKEYQFSAKLSRIQFKIDILTSDHSRLKKEFDRQVKNHHKSEREYYRQLSSLNKWVREVNTQGVSIGSNQLNTYYRERQGLGALRKKIEQNGSMLNKKGKKLNLRLNEIKEINSRERRTDK